RLTELCDRFGARFSGTTNLEAAIDWTVARLREDGFDEVRTEPVMVPRWVRGAESAELVEPTPGPLPMLGLGGSIGTPPEGITAPLLVVTNFAELAARTNEAAGRIVLFNAAFTDYGATVQVRWRGPAEAARAGAVACLIRSVTPFSLQTPHTGAMDYPTNAPRIPAAALTIEDADRLHRWQARGVTPVARLRMAAQTLPEVPSRNVLAELRGRERPEEIIVVGGHFDSWDVGQGALDDGVGCIAAWEALRQIKGLPQPPRRTLRLVLWTNEENGLRGARAYAHRPADELARHVAAIELDRGLGWPRGFSFLGGDAGLAMLRGFSDRLAPLGAGEFRRGGVGADLGPLIERGVPGLEMINSSTNYFWFHHTAADTVDKVSPAELDATVAALAVLAWSLADAPEKLPR
ncbi:MAG: M20/M25/M40 family metallo-hydrolase, partial [Limisphaerales bacterium]